MNTILPLLDRLREVNAEILVRFPCHLEEGGLGRLGLWLDQALDDSRYSWCTPTNCRTFAHTGGDGIHFSLLVVNGAITELSPVVITDPSAGGQSAIVGETLHDFLSLGAYRGYFVLAEVMDGMARALARYMNPPTEASIAAEEGFPDKLSRQMLDYLRDRLDLRPWTNPGRFADLQARYSQLLELPPDVIPR